MDKKLITFGCSFTEFSWPTWADWMGSMYPNYINLGNGGSGNRAIFHTFMEAYHKGLIDKDTDVVIQWTSLLRHDYIPFHKNNYLGLGSVIHSGNYSKEYIDNYFNPIQVINETRHYIKAIKTLLDIRRINYTMFFMLDPWLSDLLGEPWHDGAFEFPKAYKRKMRQALEALEEEFSGQVIDVSLSMYQATHQKESYYCWKADDEEIKVEGHPGPKTHYNYFLHKVLPFFSHLSNIVPDNTKILQEWETWAKMKCGEQEKFDRKPKFPSDKTRVI